MSKLELGVTVIDTLRKQDDVAEKMIGLSDLIDNDISGYKTAFGQTSTDCGFRRKHKGVVYVCDKNKGGFNATCCIANCPYISAKLYMSIMSTSYNK